MRGQTKSSWSAMFQQAQLKHVQDFLETFNPAYFPNFQVSNSMEQTIKGHVGNLVVPEQKLLLLPELVQESSWENFSDKVTEWATIYGFEVLRGFDGGHAPVLQGSAFEGLKKVALSFGTILSLEFSRLLHRYEFFVISGDIFAQIVSMFQQIPDANWVMPSENR